jgi:hypothetical protein
MYDVDRVRNIAKKLAKAVGIFPFNIAACPDVYDQGENENDY